MDITNKIDQFLDEAYEKVKGTKMDNGEFYFKFMEVKKAFTEAKDIKEYYTAVKAAIDFTNWGLKKAKEFGDDMVGQHKFIMMSNDADKDIIKLSVSTVKRLKLSPNKALQRVDDLTDKKLVQRLMMEK